MIKKVRSFVFSLSLSLSLSLPPSLPPSLSLSLSLPLCFSLSPLPPSLSLCCFWFGVFVSCQSGTTSLDYIASSDSFALVFFSLLTFCVLSLSFSFPPSFFRFPFPLRPPLASRSRPCFFLRSFLRALHPVSLVTTSLLPTETRCTWTMRSVWTTRPRPRSTTLLLSSCLPPTSPATAAPSSAAAATWCRRWIPPSPTATGWSLT